MFGIGTLDGFKRAINRWLLPRVVFSFQFAVSQVLVGLGKHFIYNFVFYTWACAAVLYNNNKTVSWFLVT